MKTSVIVAVSVVATLVIAAVAVVVTVLVRNKTSSCPQPRVSRISVDTLPVDVVFTWCEETPEWQTLKQQYTDEEATERPNALVCSKEDKCEIVYAVASIRKFMPWVNKIYILTQRPQDPHIPGTTTVFHDQVVRASDVTLPTFNSLSIESFLHRIPGLSEHFVYFNDDCFVGRPLEKSFFFTPDGKPIMYGHMYDPKYTEAPALTNTFRYIWRNLAHMFQSPVYHQIHQATALSKSICFACESLFPELYSSLRKSRFKDASQVPPVGLALNYGKLHDLVKFVTPASILQMVFDPVEQPTFNEHNLTTLVQRQPHLFCLNNIPDVNVWRVCRRYLDQMLQPHGAHVRMQVGSVVPKRIWQTWHSTTMPDGMAKAVEKVKEIHPDFQHVLMDDRQCHEFIRDNFPARVADAWEQLVPGAFKADLWRYCVLYKAGGIYLDIKYVPVHPATFHAYLGGCHFVKDRVHRKLPGIYNGFMICPPGDIRIKGCIDSVVDNVRNRFYGTSPLEPTGPALVAKWIHPDDPDVDHKYVHYSVRNKHIAHRKTKKRLVECYKDYVDEQHKTEKTPHYSKMWSKNKVYALQ